MLIAARSSQDFAFCFRAISSAVAKQASAFAASGSVPSSAISPATRLISPSYQLSFVVFTAAVASSMMVEASSN